MDKIKELAKLFTFYKFEKFFCYYHPASDGSKSLSLYFFGKIKKHGFSIKLYRWIE